MTPSSKVASTWDGAVHQASEEYSYRMVTFILYVHTYIYSSSIVTSISIL